MRNLLMSALCCSFLFVSCGRKVGCRNPSLKLYITGIDTVTRKCAYEVRRYQSGTNFTVLLDSRIDTAYKDVIEYNSLGYPEVKVDKSTTRAILLSTDDDYLVVLPSKGTEHKVENITRIELKGIREPFLNTSGGSCSVRKCSNSLSYTFDGVRKNIESGSGCYDYYVHDVEEYIN